MENENLENEDINIEESTTEETVSEENITEDTQEADKDTLEEASEEASGEASEEDSEETSEEDSEEDGDSKKKKSFFGKDKKDKESKLAAENEELKDKYKRQLAEFENFRNRTEKEKQQMFESGASSVITKILPIIDNFERGFDTIQEEDAEDAFVVGMKGVYKQLMDELTKIDVKPIEAVGKEFDPNLHNAVMQEESDEYESGIVAKELQKGYTYRDKVVRHSMVSVVQ